MYNRFQRINTARAALHSINIRLLSRRLKRRSSSGRMTISFNSNRQNAIWLSNHIKIYVCRPIRSSSPTSFQTRSRRTSTPIDRFVVQFHQIHNSVFAMAFGVDSISLLLGKNSTVRLRVMSVPREVKKKRIEKNIAGSLLKRV